VPVEVIGTSQVVYTEVDGRYTVQVPPGAHQIKVLLEGYQEKTIAVQAGQDRTVTLDVGLTMVKFAETVTVTAQAIDVLTSSAEAQLIERRQASVITDNVGSQEMKQNGDSDAAAAMSRVTGLSLVDNRYVFVRGLGERYSNTTLAGSVIPTREPDKKVVPLDLFPTGLIDSVQVSKSYSPDKSAEFAGGLVQIVPMKLPVSPVVDFTYGISFFSTGDRQEHSAQPARQPRRLRLRQRRARAAVRVSGQQDRSSGDLHARRRGHGERDYRVPAAVRQPVAPGQRQRQARPELGRDLRQPIQQPRRRRQRHHSYKEQFVEEDRRFYRIHEEGVLDTDRLPHAARHAEGAARHRRQPVIPVPAAQRITFENFYTHSGRDEGRTFQGINLDNQREYRNFRVQFIEEGLISNAVGGEHFFQGGSTSFRSRRRKPTLGTCSSTTPPPRGDLRAEQHRHGVPIQRGDSSDRRV
jgi:hypothetical protein